MHCAMARNAPLSAILQGDGKTIITTASFAERCRHAT